MLRWWRPWLREDDVVTGVSARYLGWTTVLAAAVFAVAVALALMWGQVDTVVVTRVEADGYDPSQMLPHQNAIWVAVQVAVALSAGLVGVSAIAWRRAAMAQRKHKTTDPRLSQHL